MRFPFYSAAALSVTSLCLFGSPVAGEVFARLEAAPEGWMSTGVPCGDEPIRLQIALQQKNSFGFEQTLIAMSTPGDPSYGQHFTSYQQMKEMLLPAQGAVCAVQDWLTSSGVTDVREDADWVTIRTSMARSLFVSFVPSSIPDNVTGHIRMIHPTTSFSQVHANRAVSRSMPFNVGASLTSHADNTSANQCDSITTPSCIQELYHIQDYKAEPGRGSKIAFVSFTEQVARYDDLEMFETHLAPYAVGQNFTAVEINGGVNDQNGNETEEANLDLQYIVGLAAPLPVTEHIVGGRGELIPDLTEPDQDHNSNEPFLDFLLEILKLDQEDLPQVISISYGDDEQFPSTCPWVTSVGGTNGTDPEAAVYFSSGGFSDLFPGPSYQDEAINAYLEILGDEQAEYFNRLGRGFPDVAAQSVNYVVVDKGNASAMQGTSAAAPAFSAIIALLNDARLEAGLPVMGFLNPWLYGVGRLGYCNALTCHHGSVELVNKTF